MTGKSLAANYRERILDKLQDTYLEWYEPKRGEMFLAHHFVKMADKDGENLDIVAIKANASHWPVALQVSAPVEDLNCFIRALFQGKLFRHESTLVEMTTPLGRLPDDTTVRPWDSQENYTAWSSGILGSLRLLGSWDVLLPNMRCFDGLLSDQPESVHQDLEAIDSVLEEAGLFD